MNKIIHMIFALRVIICIAIFCIINSPLAFSNKRKLVLFDYKDYMLTPYPKDHIIKPYPKDFYIKPFPQDKRLTLYQKEKMVPKLPNDYKEYRNNFKQDIILSIFKKERINYSNPHIHLRSHKSSTNNEILETRNSTTFNQHGYSNPMHFSKYQTKENVEKIQTIQFKKVNNTNKSHFLKNNKIKLAQSGLGDDVGDDPENPNPSPLKQDIIILIILILLHFSFKRK